MKILLKNSFWNFWNALSGRNNLTWRFSEGVAPGYDGFRLSGDTYRMRLEKIEMSLNRKCVAILSLRKCRSEQAKGLNHRNRGQRPRNCARNTFALKGQSRFYHAKLSENFSKCFYFNQ